MQTPTTLADRPQTRGEEIANALSHGLAFLLAVAALPVLVLHVDGAANVAAASVYAVSMMLLFLLSTLYHALPNGAAKGWFRRLDHAAIFVFIAGSYTPFTWGALRGPWGYALFGVVWGLAAVGVAVKLFDLLRHPLWSTALYVVLGWVVLVALLPLVQRMNAVALGWLVAGGVAYTVGAIVFVFDSRWRYAHFAWHVLVVAGSASHYAAALAQAA